MKTSDPGFGPAGCSLAQTFSDCTTRFQSGRIGTRSLCFLLLLTTTLTASIWAQTTVTNQGGACSIGVSCTLSLAGGSGQVSFDAVLGPNCTVGRSCGFPAGYVGSGFSYLLPDGSSASATDFTGVMTYLGFGSCGTACGNYYYTITGTFSGQDSQGRAVSGSTHQSLTISSHSRGGNTAVDTGGATTLTFSGIAQPSPSQLAFLTGPPSTVALGGSLGTVMIGVEGNNGTVVTNSTATITFSLTGPGDFGIVTQAVNASQGVATFTLSAPMTIAGQYSLSATSPGLTSPPNATITVGASPTTPDLSLTANPATLTVTPGQSAVVTLTLVPAAGYTGIQTFSCSGLPTSTTCSFNPPSLTFDGSNTPLTTQMTITVGSATALARPSRNGSHLPFGGSAYSFTLLLPAAFLCWSNKNGKKVTQWILIAALALALLMTAINCGSGSAQSTSPLSTPTSTAVVITASDSNGTSSSVNVTLTVTQ